MHSLIYKQLEAIIELPKSYCPVSLLYSLSKILEHAIYNCLSFLSTTASRILSFGFKVAHSTKTAILSDTEKLHATRSTKLSSILIFPDILAAIDTRLFCPSSLVMELMA